MELRKSRPEPHAGTCAMYSYANDLQRGLRATLDGMSELALSVGIRVGRKLEIGGELIKARLFFF